MNFMTSILHWLPQYASADHVENEEAVFSLTACLQIALVRGRVSVSLPSCHFSAKATDHINQPRSFISVMAVNFGSALAIRTIFGAVRGDLLAPEVRQDGLLFR